MHIKAHAIITVPDDMREKWERAALILSLSLVDASLLLIKKYRPASIRTTAPFVLYGDTSMAEVGKMEGSGRATTHLLCVSKEGKNCVYSCC